MSQEPAAKRIKLSDDGTSSTTATPATNGLPADSKSWTIDHVYQWAVEIVKVDPEDAQKLKTQKITGDVLHGMTEERLKSYDIPGGPAFKLSEAVLQLFPSKDASPSAPITDSDDMPCINCLISNPNDPTKSFLAEVMIDTGCSMDMILPQRKLEQLGIKVAYWIPAETVTGLGNINHRLVAYELVQVTIPLGQSATGLSREDILALPDNQKKIVGAKCWAYHSQSSSVPQTHANSSQIPTPSPTKNQPSIPNEASPEPPTSPNEISPIKRSRDRITNEFALLGWPILVNFKLRIDCKTKTLQTVALPPRPS